MSALADVTLYGIKYPWYLGESGQSIMFRVQTPNIQGFVVQIGNWWRFSIVTSHPRQEEIECGACNSLEGAVTELTRSLERFTETEILWELEPKW